MEFEKWNSCLWLDGDIPREYNDGTGEYFHFNFRDLFDFFDSKGIIGSIIFDGGLFIAKISQRDSNGWCSEIIVNSNIRQVAEDIMFTKEFKILEHQLNQQQIGG